MSSQFYQQYPSSLNPAFQNQTQQRQSRPSIDKFKYNSTTLYKNNLPINFDIDSICEDLYNCANNKSLFNEIMAGIEKEVFSSETTKKELSQTIIPHSSFSNNNYQVFNTSQKNQRIAFRNTVPEGELINSGPYLHKSFHKKYTDVNANSKYYFPSENVYPMIRSEMNKSQWTNRANRIILDSHNNYNVNNNKTLRQSSSMYNYGMTYGDGFGNQGGNHNYTQKNMTPFASTSNMIGGIKNTTTSVNGGI